MTQITEKTEAPRANRGAIAAIAGQSFVPVSGWPRLEGARERHERALAEYREARRQEAMTKDRHRVERAQEVESAATRVLDGGPPLDTATGEAARRAEVDAIGVRIRAARMACERAVREALALIVEHPEWGEEIAGRRAAAEAEREELLAQAAAAGTLAHREGHLERWLGQAVSAGIPQPYRDAGPPPAPPRTIGDVFGTAA